ncbi:enoyl-CoA hydratase/isomerase family protein [Amycolatopsis sp. K13G38]|uniref:Enoyl-CoA hydratase/isomerase family protein n=1 Tax=Amycolatopsis acididurans TaxID=2724524 RepID=A0ABX1JDK6_9PSEU|nr:enoyl-CoA hydratase/isomerase family protein [Amycolatopsis acididurans]NKQ56949.1 enoyl-CoA hydratase/isomerase family protein [Amycolatopsis acididurans]
MTELTIDTGIAVLRLDHGPVNAMGTELCRTVTALCAEAAEGPARALVITGAGPAFSAGSDLRELLRGGASYVDDFFPALAGMFGAVFSVPKPVVAAVNGHAIAGGCLLAAAADFTVMAGGATKIGAPELKVGVPFPRIGLEILRHRLGEVNARKVVVGAHNYSPEDAAALGLVDELADPEKVLPRAIEVAQRLAEFTPPDTFALTKAQLHRDAMDRLNRLDDDAEAASVWQRRVSDGWTQRYLDSLSGRPRN